MDDLRRAQYSGGDSEQGTGGIDDITAWSMVVVGHIQRQLLSYFRSGLGEERLERCVNIGSSEQVCGQCGKKGAFTPSHVRPSCYKMPTIVFGTWPVLLGTGFQSQRTKCTHAVVFFFSFRHKCMGWHHVQRIMDVGKVRTLIWCRRGVCGASEHRQHQGTQKVTSSN